MKTNPFWAQLKFEMRASSIVFIYPFTFGFQSWGLVFQATHSGTPVFASGIGIFMVISFSYMLLFQGGTFGARQSGSTWQRTLEFPFTQAISRRTLYGAKMALLGGLVLLTFLPGIFYGFLPFARKVSSSAGGCFSTALILYISSLVLLACYSAILLATQKIRWCQRVLPIAFILAPCLMVFKELAWLLTGADRHQASHISPSTLQGGVSWAKTNPTEFLIGAVLVVMPALWFGCRRFVAQEVIE
jgi:hypothetical protein